MIDIDFNSTRKSPTILKGQFPSAGMRIDDSDEQPSNAKSPINESRESDSNIIIEREEQFRKQQRSIRSTAEGMQIDESDEQFSNTQSPRHESLEPDSKAVVERTPRPQQTDCEIFSTEEGMQVATRTLAFQLSGASATTSRTETIDPAIETEFRGRRNGGIHWEARHIAFWPSYA
jgi:hypothetical protein